MAKQKNLKKWFVLSAVATALLVIPRRSSRKADIEVSNKDDMKAADKNGYHDEDVNH
jgi:hypothetical protein